jgi:copper(I)-binding protein
VNRQRSRAFAVTSGLSACGLAVAVVLTGCSAGQVSQTSVQEPAVNGTNVVAGEPTSGVALRNVHLRAPQTSDYIRPGSKVELLFVAVNESPADADRLVAITSEVGTVAVTGNATVRPNGTLVVGTPDGQPSALDATEGATTVEAAVTLTEPISNGLTYDFTFTFERSGEATVAVPISAGEAPRRDSEGASEGGAEGAVEAEGGHG